MRVYRIEVFSPDGDRFFYVASETIYGALKSITLLDNQYVSEARVFIDDLIFADPGS